MAPGEGRSPSPLLELCSSLLFAVHTQAVCMCAEATQKWEGIGSARPCGTKLQRCWNRVDSMGTFPCLSFTPLGAERRAGKGVERPEVYFFFHRPNGYSVCFAARR